MYWKLTAPDVNYLYTFGILRASTLLWAICIDPAPELLMMPRLTVNSVPQLSPQLKESWPLILSRLEFPTGNLRCPGGYPPSKSHTCLADARPSVGLSCSYRALLGVGVSGQGQPKQELVVCFFQVAIQTTKGSKNVLLFLLHSCLLWHFYLRLFLAAKLRNWCELFTRWWMKVHG